VLARENLGDDDAGVAGGERRRRECYGAAAPGVLRGGSAGSATGRQRRECYGAAAAVRFDLGLMGNEEGGGA